jgi:hypothetical protein
MGDLTAPDEGAASSARAIADELSEALVAFDHVDYNAVTVDELRELLDARDTVEELCLRYRRQQPQRGGQEAES